MADNRKQRQAGFKKGPGIFVYRGGAFDTAWEPTPLRRNTQTVKLDDQGNPVVDAQGRAVMEPAGSFVIVGGKVVMGGPPKVSRTEIDPWTLSGVTFPRGKAVPVADKALALKLRGMSDFFDEVEAVEAQAEPDSVELADLSRAELMKLASSKGLEVSTSDTKAELLEKLGVAA